MAWVSGALQEREVADAVAVSLSDRRASSPFPTGVHLVFERDTMLPRHRSVPASPSWRRPGEPDRADADPPVARVGEGDQRHAWRLALPRIKIARSMCSAVHVSRCCHGRARFGQACTLYGGAHATRNRNGAGEEAAVTIFGPTSRSPRDGSSAPGWARLDPTRVPGPRSP